MRSIINYNRPFLDCSIDAKQKNTRDPNALWCPRSKPKGWHQASASCCQKRVQEFAKKEHIKPGRKPRRLPRKTESREKPYPSVQEEANSKPPSQPNQESVRLPGRDLDFIRKTLLRDKKSVAFLGKGGRNPMNGHQQ